MESKGLPVVGTSQTAPAPAPAVPAVIPESSSKVAATSDHASAAKSKRADAADRYRYSEVSETISTLGSDGRDDASRRHSEVKKTTHSGGETVKETVWEISGCSWQVRSTTTIEKNCKNEVVHRETRDARGNVRR
ncbi:hypothetical protein Mapa_000483 [Marchantia paleacea]|nr:hypothetical protein Mapa_000483 [Marchantia paleacea]